MRALAVFVCRSFALMQKNQKIKAVKKSAKNGAASLNPPKLAARLRPN